MLTDNTRTQAREMTSDLSIYHGPAATMAVVLLEHMDCVAELESDASGIKGQLGECFDGLEDAPVLDMIRASGGLFAWAMSEMVKLEHSLSDAMEQIEAIQGTNQVHIDRVAVLEKTKVWHVRMPEGAYEVRYERGNMTIVGSPSAGRRRLKLIDQSREEGS